MAKRKFQLTERQNQELSHVHAQCKDGAAWTVCRCRRCDGWPKPSCSLHPPPMGRIIPDMAGAGKYIHVLRFGRYAYCPCTSQGESFFLTVLLLKFRSYLGWTDGGGVYCWVRTSFCRSSERFLARPDRVGERPLLKCHLSALVSSGHDDDSAILLARTYQMGTSCLYMTKASTKPCVGCLNALGSVPTMS